LKKQRCYIQDRAQTSQNLLS